MTATETFPIHWHRYGTGTGEYRASHAGRTWSIHNTRKGPFPFLVCFDAAPDNTQEYKWTEWDACTTFSSAKASVAAYQGEQA